MNRSEQNPDAIVQFNEERYWRWTLWRIFVLLSIWFIAGPLMGVLLVDHLNLYDLGGIPFGFWMAHQGAILVFVVVVFINCWLADLADAWFGVDELESDEYHPPM